MVLWSSVVVLVVVTLASVVALSGQQHDDERIIRNMVDQAVARINHGDLAAVDEFWDEQADYVGVDGTLITGRREIRALFERLASSTAPRPQQAATIEKVRFITPDVVIVDGAWIVTGARDSSGRELPPVRGRGVEVVHKKNGRWWFLATREMVIFRGN